MLTKITISGYKALFDTGPMELKALNILAGANASGKSSFVQVLLLLRQSANAEGIVQNLLLSGPLYEAGTAQDILHPSSERRISVVLNCSGENYSFEFYLDREKSEVVSSRKMEIENSCRIPKVLSNHCLNFSYLNAERIGPRVTYNLPSEMMDASGIVGKYGEYTTAVLARAASQIFIIDGWCENLAKEIARSCMELDSVDILGELIQSEGRLDIVCNLMLGWIIPGARFEAQESHNTDSTILNFIRDPEATRTGTRPTHIGFGLTYTLPIITAALALRCGGLLIVENPEAHLHPFSQSRIGVFLSLISGMGRQVIVETHSDHVINGIRLAIRNKVVNSENVILNSFSRTSDMLNSRIDQIKVSADGRPERWPEGFFDQIENDLMRL